MTSQNFHPSLEAAATEAARIARGARSAPLTDPTPCAEYDVRALLNHWILWTAHSFERRARRESVPQELIDRDFTADPDWAEAYAKQLDRAVAAWADPAAWAGEIEVMPGSALPAATVAGMVLKELLVHGWDVALATGQRLVCPVGAGELVLAVVVEHGELYRQYGGFADPVAVPASAPAFDRALGLSGRDPAWQR